MTGRTDYALIIGGTISRKRADYRELCRGCHMRYDHGGKKRSATVCLRIKEGKQRHQRETLEWAFTAEHIGKVK